MNNHIYFDGEKYVLTADKASEIGISEEFFQHFKTLMLAANKRIQGKSYIMVGNNKLRLIDINTMTRIKTRTENDVSPGGIDCFYEYWAGCHWYISHRTLKILVRGGSIIAAASSAGAGPLAAAAFITIMFLSDDLLDNYPNGIDISGEWYDDNGDAYIFKRWEISGQ